MPAFSSLKNTALLLSCCALAAVWTLWAFFPGMTVANMVLLSAVMLGMATVALVVPYRSRTTVITFITVALLLGAGVIVNAWYFTYANGGTPSKPVLQNYDSARWWNDALYHLGRQGGVEAAASFGFYGRVLSAFLWVFGVNVGNALILSMIFILASLVLCGLTTYRLTGKTHTAALSCICLAAVAYWLTMGTLILKDAMVILALGTAAYGFAQANRRMALYVLFAVLLLILCRPGLIWLVILGLILICINRNNVITVLLTTLGCVVLGLIPVYLSTTASLGQVVSSDLAPYYSFDTPDQMAYYNVVGNYMELPFYTKLLYLPATIGVQFLIPFFWTFARDIVFGPTEVWAHMGCAWYAFGFIFVYYLVSRWCDCHTTLYRLSVFALLCWCVPCFIFGGTVSRYGLPFVALMAPAVAVTLLNNLKKRRFYVIFGAYALCLIGVLIVAYHLQTSAAI